MGKRLDASRIVTKYIDVDLLDDHPDNPQIHPDAQITQLAASNDDFGQYHSIVVWARPNNRYTRVTGHGYSKGAIKTGTTSLRCEILPEDTDPLTVKAIMMADNQHAKHSHTNENALERLLQEQHTHGFNLMALGSYSDLFEKMSSQGAQAFQETTQQISMPEMLVQTPSQDRFFEPVEELAKNPDQELETYLHGTIRQIILLYSPEQFTVVLDLFEKLRKEHPEIESNTDCVSYLIEQYFQVKL